MIVSLNMKINNNNDYNDSKMMILIIVITIIIIIIITMMVMIITITTVIVMNVLIYPFAVSVGVTDLHCPSRSLLTIHNINTIEISQILNFHLTPSTPTLVT